MAITWADALQRAGDKALNSIWEVRLPFAVEAGNFTLSFNGETTIPLPFNASALLIATALQELATVEAGNAKADGVKKGPYYVMADGELGGQYIEESMLTANGDALVPPMPPTVKLVQPGQSAEFAAKAQELWLSSAEKYLNDEIRMLSVALAIINIRIAALSDSVNHRERDYESNDSKKFDQALKLKNEILRDLAQAEKDAKSSIGHNTLQTSIRKETPDGLPYGTFVDSLGAVWRP